MLCFSRKIAKSCTLALENTVTSLDENTDTSNGIKVADIKVTDDGLGNNILSLTGEDASYFEINGTELYLKADTAIDYETNNIYDVTVELDDTSIGDTLEASESLSIAINDFNEAPTLTVDLATDFTFDRYLTLDGNSYVEIDSDSIRLDANYTFEAWINSNDATSGVFAKSNASGYNSGEKTLNTFNVGENLSYSVRIPSGSGGNYPKSITGNTSVTDGEWHHVALTWDKNNTTVSIYVDGELDIQETNSAFDLADNEGDTFKIGIDYQSVYGLTGEMKDVRFWNVTRSQTEIQTDLNTTLTGTETGLVAHYDFASVNSNTVSDRTGNGNEGVLVNNAQQVLEFEIPENIGSDVKIADINFTDEDSIDAYLNNTLSISGDDADKFVLNGTELYLADGVDLDGINDPQLNLTVELNDDTYSGSLDLDIAVAYVNDQPVLSLSNTVTSLAEDTDTSSRIKVADLTITTSDSDSHEFTLSGNDADLFEIVNDSELYLKADTSLDYESDTQLDVTVTIDDGTYSDSESLSIAITDVAIAISLSSVVSEIEENSRTDSVRLAHTAVSESQGDYTITLVDDKDADKFEIDHSNRLYLKSGTILDYEVDTQLDVTIQVSDSDGNSNTVDYSLNILDVDEGAISLSNILSEISQNADTTTRIEVADIMPKDTEVNYTFYLTGEDADIFEVDGNKLYLKAGASLVKESGYSLFVTLNAASLSETEEVEISLLTPSLGMGDLVEESELFNGDGVNFGSVNVASGKEKYQFELLNFGEEELRFDYITINGEDKSDFNIIGDIPTSIEPFDINFDVEIIEIEFDPSSGGDLEATLEIGSNDYPENPFFIFFSGTGIGTEIDVTQRETELVSGTTQNFGSINIDAGTIQQTFTINNTGTETLNVGDISLTGTNVSDFTLKNSSAIANTTLTAGASTDITVTFDPSTVGEATATLTINSDDNDEAVYTIDLAGIGNSTTKVEGSDNDDVINNEEGNQTIDAGAGDDTVTGSNTSENVRGGDGNDEVDSGAGNDRNYGDAGDDVLVGGAGRDFLRGGADNDIMFGGDDNDYLVGDDGEDYLNGELGSDRLRGGSDSDTFVLRLGDGTDFILDFNVDEDHFELDGLEVSDLTLEDDGSFALIKAGDETLVKVRNVTASELEDYFTNRYSS